MLRKRDFSKRKGVKLTSVRGIKLMTKQANNS